MTTPANASQDLAVSPPVGDLTKKSIGVARLFFRLWSEFAPAQTKRVLLWFLLAVIVLGGTQGLEVYMIKPLLETISSPSLHSTDLTPLALLYLCTGIIKAVGMYFEVHSLARFTLGIGRILRERLMSAVLGINLRALNQDGPSYYLGMFFSDLEKLVANLRQILDAIVGQGIVLLAIFGVMLAISPILCLVTLALFAAVGVPLIIIGRRVRRTTAMVQNDLSQMTGTISEVLRGMKQVRLFNRQSSVQRDMAKAFLTLFRLETRAWVSMAPVAMVTAFSLSLIIAMLIWGGQDQLRSGNLTIAHIASFFAALITAYRPIRVLSNVGPLILGAAVSLERIFSVIDRPNVDKATRHYPELTVERGEIEFDDVSFYYQIQGLPAVRNISLVINPGETVALVGPTGSGKSTLVSLIPRFFDPVSGRVLIDGHDVRGVNVFSLRKQIALVSQDVVLFSGTIRSNICFASENLSDADIKIVLLQVGIWDTICSLPEGLNTQISEDGHGLSGGQRQLISIARALLSNAPILLFDEPTASLDSHSEDQIRDLVETLLADRTTLIVAHRLSTIRRADRIIVLEDGTIKEEGTHDQLIRERGLYASYAAKQFSGLHNGE